MFLDATSKSLEIVLAGAVTTNQLPWTADVGQVASDNSTSAPLAFDGATNGGTPVTMVAAPGASLVREVLHASIHNDDTAAATVTVQLNDSGTRLAIVTATLSVGDQLLYTFHGGWQTLDAQGNLKTTSLPASMGSTTTLTLPAAFVLGQISPITVTVRPN